MYESVHVKLYKHPNENKELTLIVSNKAKLENKRNCQEKQL